MSTQTESQTMVYTIDASHSTVEFIVRHLMISKVRGRFAAFEGSIEMAQGADIPQSLNVSIDAASINTHEPQRDAHLRSADFFEVEKYPKLTFASKNIQGTPDDFTVTGDLTMHGVTREVTLAAQFEGRGGDPWGNQRAAFSATATINRKDFGLGWNAALETGGVVVSEEVKIDLNVEAIAQK